MAAGATIHTFTGHLADVDRGVYDEIALRVARHPSETDAFMLTRVLAYCLEFEEGIAFSEGISAIDEPAVLVRDLTGRLTAWIEVGAPDAARLHYGSKLADRTAVYTHRDPAKVVAAWTGKTIHRAETIRVRSFDRGFVDAAAAALERRNTITVSVTEGHLYLDLNGVTLSSSIHERSATDVMPGATGS
ncbi:YaeQ family protein [Microbacterium sp. LRZ72]|uniref:YaeQ family protein n=1 Tax=Microbacterium sp. LRZ72 TaxID=2942481 RepID=UPI0029AF2130|nr:YaeQ family protein [Microbacterium sp. LRZ72]MDX2376745.1 YaeQ family protein [Microbacterium sp. LRZ72]